MQIFGVAVWWSMYNEMDVEKLLFTRFLIQIPNEYKLPPIVALYRDIITSKAQRYNLLLLLVAALKKCQCIHVLSWAGLVGYMWLGSHGSSVHACCLPLSSKIIRL
jgi:hypothetical protein